VDTASGFCSFGGLRLVLVVRLLGTRISVRKFLLSLYYIWVAPPVPLLVGLGGRPSPVGAFAHLVFLLSCWVTFWVAHLVLSRARQGLTPLGFPFFLFLRFVPCCYVSARFSPHC